MSKAKIHVCTRTIGQNNRRKKNEPCIIVMANGAEYDDGIRARTVIITDRRGQEVARVVQVDNENRLSTGSNCWIETMYDAVIEGETKKVKPIEAIPEYEKRKKAKK
mgnify:CR=1 FL=1